MAPKIDFLYPFDKGFFGKNLSASKSVLQKNYRPSKLKFDSIDDMTKYFDNEMFQQRLTGSPKTDIVEKQPKVSNNNTLTNFGEY